MHHQDCLLFTTSHLISLELTPPPTLSQNLSGSPLITVHLKHRLVSGGAFALVAAFDLVSH